MSDRKTVKVKKFDPSFDAKAARKFQRDGLRVAVFNRIRDEADAGRAFVKVDRSLVSQELLEELVRLGYSVTKRPQYEDDPVRITWGEDYRPHAKDSGEVDYVEAGGFSDARETAAGFCSDY